jgi:hypothetical protein
MKTLVWMIAAILISTAMPSFGAPNSIGEYFTNTTFWQHLNWHSIDDSPLARAVGWTQIQASPDMKGASKTATVSLLGNEWQAEMKHGKVPLVRLKAKELPKSDCDRLLKELSSRFGTPLFANNGIRIKYSNTTFMNMLLLVYQWDIGGTRINGICDAITNQDSENTPVYNWSILYFPLDGINKLVPDIALKCDEKSHGTDMSEFAMIVNFDSEQVKRPDGTALSEANTFYANDTEIRFDVAAYSEKRDKITVKYFISRVTGELYAQHESQGKLKPFIGHCEKVDHLENKF